MQKVQYTLFAVNFIKMALIIQPQQLEKHCHKLTMCFFLLVIPVICIRYFAHTPYTVFAMVATCRVLEEDE